MIGIDTNILVALAIGSHPLHHQTSCHTQRQQDQGRHFVLTPLIIAEFLHLVSDTRRMNPALEIADASEWIQTWIVAMKAQVVYENEASTKLCLHWLRDFKLGRKRIHDTHLASTLHCHGINRLLTYNIKDFNVFGVFELITP